MSRKNESGFAGAIAVLVVLIIIGGLLTMFTSMRFIGTGEVGVVTAYGKVTGRELTEGLAWVKPWGANNVTKYDIKTLKVEAKAKAATRDLQDVNATVVINYQLNRGKVSEVHQKVGKDYQAIVIDPQIQEAFKAVSAKYTASELITERAAVKKAVLENLKERIEKDDRYTIQDIAITNFKFSEAFNQAIEAVQVANQQVAKAKQQLAQAQIDAEKKITQARAEAEAQRLQQQTLTKELLQKYAIDEWDGKLPTTYAGNSGSIFSIPVK